MEGLYIKNKLLAFINILGLINMKLILGKWIGFVLAYIHI